MNAIGGEFIVVGVDESPAANQAAQWAADDKHCGPNRPERR